MSAVRRELAAWSFVAVVGALPLVACPSTPLPVTPLPDASDAAIDSPGPDLDASRDARRLDAGDIYAAACFQLHALHCPEGDDVTWCTATMHEAATHVANLAPACVADAWTQAAVRACSPSLRCAK